MKLLGLLIIRFLVLLGMITAVNSIPVILVVVLGSALFLLTEEIPNLFNQAEPSKPMQQLLAPVALWSIGFFLFMDVYFAQTVYSSEWYVILVIFILFLGGALLQEASASALYITMALMMGLLVWSTPEGVTILDASEVAEFPTDHQNWLEIYVWFGLATLAYTITHTPRGSKLLKSWGANMLAMFLITWVFLGVFAEIFIRTSYSRYEVLGPYPKYTVPEYNEPRQQWGAADMPFALEKPEDTLRVLLIGDSFTYGDAIFAKDRFATQLQAYDTENLEVVVLAENGASTQDQLSFWDEYGAPVQADIVIVGTVQNDPDMGLLDEPYFIARPLFISRFSRSQFSFYLDSLNSLIRVYYAPEYRSDYGIWESQLYSEENLARWQNQAVIPLYEAITASGAEAWAYVFSPILSETDEKYKYDALETVFTDSGFKTMSFVPLLQERYAGVDIDYCALPNDCHPNPEIHQFFAEVIWQDLQPYMPN